MFDRQTSRFLASAPSLPTLDSNTLPALLTRHYAELVSVRLRSEDDAEGHEIADEQWPLERIADVYETIASLEEDVTLRRAAAFVAGTARLIISRAKIQQLSESRNSPIDRDSLDPSTAAAVLFLAAAQYADAFEAVNFIPKSRGPFIIRTLGDDLKSLASGRLNEILLRAGHWRTVKIESETMQDHALSSLVAVLIEGIELLAAEIMSLPAPDTLSRKYTNANEAFNHVIKLSYKETKHLRMTYAGPSHLASLLLSAAETLRHAALTKLPPPDGADKEFWNKWLRFRADGMPYLWPNHKEAIDKGFYQTGQSAVLILPTGAGKTTVSVLKIAGTLARGKKVVFLVPTHALVDQLTEDLQSIFPSDKFGMVVSSDFDSLLMEGAQLKPIEVMTPERCLAMLSFTPAVFENVGLLVFDECHILSPQSGRIGRSLDGMLCLLSFCNAVPHADLLFLSAMLKNGQQFAEWVVSLTGRPCEAIDLLWKPSRQARGVVVYDESEIVAASRRANQKQREINKEKGKTAKTLRSAAKKELVAIPNVVWGLQYNWLPTHSIAFTKIMNEPVQLGGNLSRYGGVWVTPNANKVAAKIATRANKANLKTIIFVNTKDDAVSTSRSISSELEEDGKVELNTTEVELQKSLEMELGHLKHSVFGESGFSSVPHNSAMLRLERMLSERLFRRSNGAKVIVATPTLAQGLNLPAHLAILAGDKRTSNEQEREELEAHELLNAAARAGRAGYLANGVVILIPEPVINFRPGRNANADLEQKLLSVLPEDDRCVIISDPLEVVLDRISEGKLDDREVRYTINRLAVLTAEADTTNPNDFISHSLGVFMAKQRGEEEGYIRKIERLWKEAKEVIEHGPHHVEIRIASQSGVPLDLLQRLRLRLLESAGTLPNSIPDWVRWTVEWLCADTLSRDHLLKDVSKAALTAAGKSVNSTLDSPALMALLPGIQGWINGIPLNDMERSLGGDPEGETLTLRVCPRARALISTFIPRGFSFILMLVSRMVEELNLYDAQESLDKSIVNNLSIAVRKGYNSTEKLEFSNGRKHIQGRVHIHKLYDQATKEN